MTLPKELFEITKLLNVNVRYSKEKLEIDSKLFPECKTREKEIRIKLKSKKYFYIHRYKDKWEVLIIPDMKHFVFRETCLKTGYKDGK